MGEKKFCIGLFVFDGVDEMDVVGPWEVLAWWSRLAPQDRKNQPKAEREVEVFTFSLPLPKGRDYVNGGKGLRIVPDRIWNNGVLPLDALFYLGGQDMTTHFVGGEYSNGLRPEIKDMLDQAFASGALPVSVCVGALVYAAYGVFDGKAATTHFKCLDLLARLGGNIDVRGDERFVDDRTCLSSAGISAGIDMSLHFVARFASPDMARKIKRTMQYYPAPPVDAIVSPPWDPPNKPLKEMS